MENVIKNIALGYARLFPELLDRFHKNNDLTIVDLIAEKAEKKIKTNLINVGELKKNIVFLLKTGL